MVYIVALVLVLRMEREGGWAFLGLLSFIIWHAGGKGTEHNYKIPWLGSVGFPEDYFMLIRYYHTCENLRQRVECEHVSCVHWHRVFLVGCYFKYEIVLWLLNAKVKLIEQSLLSFVLAPYMELARIRWMAVHKDNLIANQHRRRYRDNI